LPDEVLEARRTWKDPEAYDEAARKMAGLLNDNSEEFGDRAATEVREAGPKVS
jgi:phosphoenolpyruvate carboxykinase (ATP)